MDTDLYFVVVTRMVDAAERVTLYGPYAQERAMRAANDAIAAGPCRTDILTRAELDAQATDGSPRGDQLCDAIRAAKLREPEAIAAETRFAAFRAGEPPAKLRHPRLGLVEHKPLFDACASVINNGVERLRDAQAGTFEKLTHLDVRRAAYAGFSVDEIDKLVDVVAQACTYPRVAAWRARQAYSWGELGTVVGHRRRRLSVHKNDPVMRALPDAVYGRVVGCCGPLSERQFLNMTPQQLINRTAGSQAMADVMREIVVAAVRAGTVRTDGATAPPGSFLALALAACAVKQPAAAASTPPVAEVPPTPDVPATSSSTEDLSAIFRRVEHVMPEAVRALLQSTHTETLQDLLGWHVSALARNGINGMERGLAIAALIQVADLHRIAFRAIIRDRTPAVGTLGAICAAWLSAIEPSELHKQLQLPPLLVVQLAACGITTVAQLVMCDMYTLQKQFGLSLGQVADVMRAISDAAPATRQLMEKLEPGRSGALLTMYRS